MSSLVVRDRDHSSRLRGRQERDRTAQKLLKSKPGILVDQTHRDISFCGHAINHDGVFVVEDAFLDARFSENPPVTNDPNVRFYAGAPITAGDGQKIGMLCVLDHQPRQFTDAQRAKLTNLARKVEAEIRR